MEIRITEHEIKQGPDTAYESEGTKVINVWATEKDIVVVYNHHKLFLPKELFIGLLNHNQ